MTVRVAGLRARGGPPDATGTKLFSLSGHVARPGVYEVEFGITLRELIAWWRAASRVAAR